MCSSFAARTLGVLSVCLMLSGCSLFKLRTAVEQLNTAEPAGRPPAPRTPVERSEQLTASQLADAYYDPRAVAGWLRALAAAPEPLLELVDCIDRARQQARSASPCHAAFSAPGSPAHAWGLPATPPASPDRADPSARRELDASRLLANAHALAASLSQLRQNHGGDGAGFRQGVLRGANRAAAYLEARRWQRGTRPSTALVLGGGSANGAFGAGFVWRLLDVLDLCRAVGEGAGGCGDAGIDLVVGTSVGTLIGALVDLHATPGHEQQARELLIDNFTCSVEADLYCVPDAYVWTLFHGARGIVYFDGIAARIDRFITPEVENNGLELVGVTQDLRYGEVLGFSDQDPADRMVGCGRRDALLASIVLPVMAEPVASIGLESGVRVGPYVDGGVGSVVPMLEAVQRGAGRVVVVSMYPNQPEPVAEPRNAFDVLLRSMTLAMLQPGPNEIAHAELLATTRRRLGQHVCRARVDHWHPSALPEPWAAFCGAPAEDAWSGPLPLSDASEEFRSAWVFRDEDIESTLGYRFDPVAMRALFRAGVESFQRRCPELLEVLGIQGSVARAACDDPEATARARFADLSSCKTRPMPTCGGPPRCDSGPWRFKRCTRGDPLEGRMPPGTGCTER